MGPIATAYVEVRSQLSPTFGPELQSGINSKIGGIAKAAAGTFAAGFAADKAFAFVGSALSEAREAQRVAAITQATIKATKGAAGLTAIEISNLANTISKKTGIDDEAIQVGENQLLTFKKIRDEVGKGSDVFRRATEAAVDLSKHGFGDITSTSVQLGKALEDPIKGLASLTRVGVTFSAQQKDQITALVTNGDLLGAQKVLLAAVEGQVKGTAAAQATAGDKANVAFGNLKEAIGTGLLPVLDKLFTTLTPIFTKLAENGDLLKAVLIGIGVAATIAAIPLIAAAAPFIEIGIGIAALIVLIERFRPQIVEFGQTVANVFGSITNAVGVAVDFIRDHIDEALRVLLFFATGGLSEELLFVTTHFDAIVGFVASLPGRIRDAAAGMFNGIRDAFRSAINSIIDGWNNLSFTLPSIEVFGRKIGGFTLSTPNISRLASGGITSGPLLALLGDNPSGREAVIPLDDPRARGMLGGESISVNVNFHGALPTGEQAYETGRQVGRGIEAERRELRRAQRVA